jgi:hypothetical protein
MPGGSASPMAPVQQERTGQEPQVQPKSTGIPCAMVLTLMACSPRGSGFLAPVAREIITHELSASVEAPGPHVFAVRSSITRPRKNARRCHRVHRNLPRVS